MEIGGIQQRQILFSRDKGALSAPLKKNADLRRKSHDRFIEEISEINPNIEILGLYQGAFKKLDCRCKIHDVVFVGTPTHLLTGKTGCGHCEAQKIHDRLAKSHNQYVAELHKVNSSIIVEGTYVSANEHINVRCNKCGHHWSPTANSLLCGFGCPACSSSKGEEKIRLYLKEHHILFEQHKRYDDLRGIGGSKKHLPLSYDFYLCNYNCLIEYQGQFHDHTAYQQTEEAFRIQQQHDYLKRQYAKEHNINLLEIWYPDFNNIERILDDYLENPVTTTVT